MIEGLVVAIAVIWLEHRERREDDSGSSSSDVDDRESRRPERDKATMIKRRNQWRWRRIPLAVTAIVVVCCHPPVTVVMHHGKKRKRVRTSLVCQRKKIERYVLVSSNHERCKCRLSGTQTSVSTSLNRTCSPSSSSWSKVSVYGRWWTAEQLVDRKPEVDDDWVLWNIRLYLPVYLPIHLLDIDILQGTLWNNTCQQCSLRRLGENDATGGEKRHRWLIK